MKYFIILCFISSFTACMQDAEQFFTDSPTTRAEKTLLSLREKLVSAENGWEMTYFPEIDSTKFSDIRKDLNAIPDGFIFIHSYFGKGGYKFFIKFNQDGTLQMTSDQVSGETPRTSQFEVNMSTYAQLSFTTPNYHLKCKQNDFLFYEETRQGELVFRTLRHDMPGMEYIIFKKLPATLSLTDVARKVSMNRYQFEKMERYKLTIMDIQGKILYETNHAPGVGLLESNQIIHTGLRYVAFLRADYPPVVPKIERSGLASGYAPSLDGIELHPGLRFNQETLFNYFRQQRENVYTCEVNGFKAIITYPKD